MKKKERLQYKDGSDVYIKGVVKGMDKLGGKGNASIPQKRQNKLRLNTDDTLKKYSGSFAQNAASPSVKSNPDAKMNVESNRESLKNNARSRGLNQSKYKGRK